jgi:hypothetical protein
LNPSVRSIWPEVAADRRAVLAQDRVLPGDRLGRPEDVPDVRVLGPTIRSVFFSPPPPIMIGR